MISRLLVFGQFASIALLLFGEGWNLPWWSWSIFVLGLALFGWACASLGGMNFTIMPEPRSGNTLSGAGIYGLLRHPMYTAVIMCGIAVAFGVPNIQRWIALCVCCVVLVIKVRHEERLLVIKHPEYQKMMSRTKRLLPGIW